MLQCSLCPSALPFVDMTFLFGNTHGVLTLLKAWAPSCSTITGFGNNGEV